MRPRAASVGPDRDPPSPFLNHPNPRGAAYVTSSSIHLGAVREPPAIPSRRLRDFLYFTDVPTRALAREIPRRPVGAVRERLSPFVNGPADGDAPRPHEPHHHNHTNHSSDNLHPRKRRPPAKPEAFYIRSVAPLEPAASRASCPPSRRRRTTQNPDHPLLPTGAARGCTTRTGTSPGRQVRKARSG